jgi:hypothetical protein
MERVARTEMIQSDRTICATAGRAAVEGHRYQREENIPAKWLGVGANWRERLLFDWSYIACSCRRSYERIRFESGNSNTRSSDEMLALALYAEARAHEIAYIVDWVRS